VNANTSGTLLLNNLAGSTLSKQLGFMAQLSCLSTAFSDVDTSAGLTIGSMKPMHGAFYFHT
jgi:hypothetical protein